MLQTFNVQTLYKMPPQTYFHVWPVTSFLTNTCSTIHLGDMPVLSWPMRNVVSSPKFLCCQKKEMVRTIKVDSLREASVNHIHYTNMQACMLIMAPSKHTHTVMLPEILALLGSLALECWRSVLECHPDWPRHWMMCWHHSASGRERSPLCMAPLEHTKDL